MEKEYKYPKSIQTLVGLLRRHKITISKSYTTRIRGWHDQTTGVVIQKKWNGTYLVGEYKAEKGLMLAYESMKAEGYHITDENLPNSFIVQDQPPA